MLGCFSMCYIRVVNRTGFLSHGLPMMHKQMCGVLTWQQIRSCNSAFVAITPDRTWLAVLGWKLLQ
uniref:Uncharacterized protein n=1 Tax=Glycine max TaxID=3847 RepID=C6TD28_SOYBN|nr:unknown [Glycine max]